MKKYILLLFLCITNLGFGAYIVTPFKNAKTNKIDFKGKEIAYELTKIDNITFLERDFTQISSEIQLKYIFEDSYEPKLLTADKLITGEYFYENNLWTILVKIIDVNTAQIKSEIVKDTNFSDAVLKLRSVLTQKESFKLVGKHLLNNADSYKTVQLALNYLLQSIKVEGDDWETYFLIGEIYQYQTKFEDAIDAYQIALKLTVNPIEQMYIMTSLGTVFTKLNLVEKALEMYNKALSLCETNDQRITVKLNIGNVYVRQKLFQKAINLWTELYNSTNNKQLQSMLDNNIQKTVKYLKEINK